MRGFVVLDVPIVYLPNGVTLRACCRFGGTNISSAQLAQLYPPSDYSARAGASPAWWAVAQIFTDSQMLCPSHQAAGWFTAGGNANVYVYYFVHVLWAIEHVLDQLKPTGCCHARCARQLLPAQVLLILARSVSLAFPPYLFLALSARYRSYFISTLRCGAMAKQACRSSGSVTGRK